MKLKAARLFAAVICGAVLWVVAQAQSREHAEWDNGVTERWWVDLSVFAKPELDAAIERWGLIAEGNRAARSHEWAGGYFTGGETHGTYLRWSPEAGFVMAHVDKCAAMLTGLSYGRVVASQGSVEFVFEYRKSSGAHGHAESHASPAPPVVKFVPVRWSHDQYLVREDEAAEFGDYAAGLGKYNTEFAWVDGVAFFARSTSEAKSNYEELPQVPPGYERFIKKPIDARVSAVGAPRLKRQRTGDSLQYEKHIPVSLDIGSLGGVKPGMFFHVLSSDQGETLKVVRVGRHSSEGVIVRWADENKQEYQRYPKIRVGWRVSTSPHKKFSANGET